MTLQERLKKLEEVAERNAEQEAELLELRKQIKAEKTRADQEAKEFQWISQILSMDTGS